MLGVRRDASPTEIRRAFAAGVRAAHPDAGGSAAAASERLAELIAARDVALQPRVPAAVSGRVEGYHRPNNLERLVGIVLTGLGWGRPKPPGRNLR